jgi:hypothetical protein
MPDPGRAARRLAGAALTALALTAAAGVVDNPAPASPPSVTLPDGAPRPAGWGAARLPAGEGADPPDPAGPVLGVVGGRPGWCGSTRGPWNRWMGGGSSCRLGPRDTPDPEATCARWQAGRLLAFGSSWDGEAQRERGSGLTMYAHGDRLGRHLLGDRAVLDARLRGDLVYAAVDRGGEQPGRVVLSLSTGRVLASSDDPLPDLLPGERDSLC